MTDEKWQPDGLDMIVAANQPFFAPYPGFFEKCRHADVLVLLDSVQFPRGTTWMSRNRFKNDQGTLWLSVPVWRKGLGLQSITEVRICWEGNWKYKHLQSLTAAYQKAPFFVDHFPCLESVYISEPERLLDLNRFILGYLLKQLGLSTRIVFLSELEIETRGPDLPPAICRRLGSKTFLAQSSAAKHLDTGRFRKEGIELRLFPVSTPVYPQLWGPFLPNLSIFDLLFCCGPRAGNYLGDTDGGSRTLPRPGTNTNSNPLS